MVSDRLAVSIVVSFRDGGLTSVNSAQSSLRVSSLTHRFVVSSGALIEEGTLFVFRSLRVRETFTKLSKELNLVDKRRRCLRKAGGAILAQDLYQVESRPRHGVVQFTFSNQVDIFLPHPLLVPHPLAQKN